MLAVDPGKLTAELTLYPDFPSRKCNGLPGVLPKGQLPCLAGLSTGSVLAD